MEQGQKTGTDEPLQNLTAENLSKRNLAAVNSPETSFKPLYSKFKIVAK